MKESSRTIALFAPYPLLAGLSMALVPALPLQILGLPVEGLDWIRMLGVVTAIVGYYYWRLGRAGVTAFCCWSVQMRAIIPLVFTALVLLFDLRPIYILFTLPDFAGALWTWRALHREGINPFGPLPASG